VRTKTGRKTLQDRAQMSAWIAQMRLPAPVGETAGEIATAWLSRHKQRGTARRGVLVAAVFHACRIRGAPMTSKELARATAVPLPSLTEACKKMGATGRKARTRRSVRTTSCASHANVCWSAGMPKKRGLSWQNAGGSARTGLDLWPFRAGLRLWRRRRSSGRSRHGAACA
jgi:hypothetical protein